MLFKLKNALFSLNYLQKFKSPANEGGRQTFHPARNSPQLHQQRKLPQTVTDPFTSKEK
jgi:hypothetical protein